MLGPLAKRPPVGLLADECDRSRSQLTRKRLEPVGTPREVRGAEIARAGRRAVRRVRDADPERQEVELLDRIEESGGETGGMKQSPEVVARVRKVRLGRVGEAARVDSAKDDAQTRRKNVRDRGGRLPLSAYAASGSRDSRPASNASRIRSVNAEGDSVITGSPGRTTLTVSSLPLWP